MSFFDLWFSLWLREKRGGEKTCSDRGIAQDEAVVSVDGNGKLCAKTAGETKVVGTIYGEEYECRVVVE